jgi:hypothetical protein
MNRTWRDQYVGFDDYPKVFALRIRINRDITLDCTTLFDALHDILITALNDHDEQPQVEADKSGWVFFYGLTTIGMTEWVQR